jgi:hypothetical protein
MRFRRGRGVRDSAITRLKISQSSFDVHIAPHLRVSRQTSAHVLQN